MAHLNFSWTTIFVIFLLNFLSHGLSYTEVNVGYPARTMDYKIHVDAGKEDCVFQYAHAGAVFYVDFHVIRGGDGQASFMVQDPQGIIVLPYEWQTKATYETEKAVEGYYKVCIDNKQSQFSAKLVSVYMATYEAAGWDKFVEDLNEIKVDTDIFVQSFSAISQRVEEVILHLHNSKSREARDFALLNENNYNVGFWSFIQMTIILLSGFLHVYYIRQLFRETPNHGNYKVRL